MAGALLAAAAAAAAASASRAGVRRRGGTCVSEARGGSVSVIGRGPEQLGAWCRSGFVVTK